MHDWQHTGYQKSKFLKDSNLKSASSEDVGKCFFECGHVETPFHYMQCTSKILHDARVKGKAILERSLCKMHTAPSLLEAILQGIHRWEDGTEYDLEEDSNKYLFNEAHTQLLASQREIGWDKFIKGYISKDWGYIQEQYYLHTKTVQGKKYTRNNWVILLLHSLYVYRHSIWMTRNQSLHGGINADQKHFNRTKLQKMVTKLYRKDRSMLPCSERSLFNLPLQLQRKQGNQQLQLWINRAHLLFDTYKDVPIRKSQQRSITQWLQVWSPKETGETSTSYTNKSARASFSERQSNDIIDYASDDDDVRHDFSQTNLTNWLKSWGQSEDSTGSTVNDQKDIDKKGYEKSIGDEMPAGQHS
jgi:hypothetical protein